MTQFPLQCCQMTTEAAGKEEKQTLLDCQHEAALEAFNQWYSLPGQAPHLSEVTENSNLPKTKKPTKTSPYTSAFLFQI